VNDQTAISPYRQQKRDRMVQTILDAARAIMREKGVAALTMQELSRRLDLRAPSLYNYFSGKMELYDALFRLGYTLFAERMESVRRQAQTWQEYTRLGFESYLSFALENPDLYQLCFERPVPGFTPSAESLEVSQGSLQKAYQDMARFITELETDRTPEQLVDLLIAVMHGVTAMHLANQPDFPAGQGRFGSLFPVVFEVLERAWSKP
jgi:AcrR family transcriptional regulator